jgi:hypothetical protein
VQGLSDFRDSTAFERLALEQAAGLLPTTPPGRRGGAVDLRQNKTFVSVGAIEVGGGAEAVERLHLSLRPLMFGAAWKVLDLMIELALGPPRGSRWSIEEKRNHALARTVPHLSPFENSDPCWPAAFDIYAHTVELRHGLTHRAVDVSSARDLTVVDRNGATHTLTADEQLSFCRAAQRLTEGILAGSISNRDYDDLCWQLRSLPGLLRTVLPSGRDFSAVFEVIADLPVVDSWVKVDVPALIERVKRSFTQARTIDLVGYLPNHQDHPLVGPLDNAPQEIVRFPLGQPPPWLRETLRFSA